MCNQSMIDNNLIIVLDLARRKVIRESAITEKTQKAASQLCPTTSSWCRPTTYLWDADGWPVTGNMVVYIALAVAISWQNVDFGSD